MTSRVRVTFFTRFDEYVECVLIPVKKLRHIEENIAGYALQEDVNYRKVAYFDALCDYLYGEGHVAYHFMTNLKYIVDGFHVRIYDGAV